MGKPTGKSSILQRLSAVFGAVDDIAVPVQCTCAPFVAEAARAAADKASAAKKKPPRVQLPGIGTGVLVNVDMLGDVVVVLAGDTTAQPAPTAAHTAAVADKEGSTASPPTAHRTRSQKRRERAKRARAAQLQGVPGAPEPRQQRSPTSGHSLLARALRTVGVVAALLLGLVVSLVPAATAMPAASSAQLLSEFGEFFSVDVLAEFDAPFEDPIGTGDHDHDHDKDDHDRGNHAPIPNSLDEVLNSISDSDLLATSVESLDEFLGDCAVGESSVRYNDHDPNYYGDNDGWEEMEVLESSAKPVKRTRVSRPPPAPDSARVAQAHLVRIAASAQLSAAQIASLQQHAVRHGNSTVLRRLPVILLSSGGDSTIVLPTKSANVNYDILLASYAAGLGYDLYTSLLFEALCRSTTDAADESLGRLLSFGTVLDRCIGRFLQGRERRRCSGQNEGIAQWAEQLENEVLSKWAPQDYVAQLAVPYHEGALGVLMQAVSDEIMTSCRNYYVYTALARLKFVANYLLRQLNFGDSEMTAGRRLYLDLVVLPETVEFDQQRSDAIKRVEDSFSSQQIESIVAAVAADRRAFHAPPQLCIDVEGLAKNLQVGLRICAVAEARQHRSRAAQFRDDCGLLAYRHFRRHRQCATGKNAIAEITAADCPAGKQLASKQQKKHKSRLLANSIWASTRQLAVELLHVPESNWSRIHESPEFQRLGPSSSQIRALAEKFARKGRVAMRAGDSAIDGEFLANNAERVTSYLLEANADIVFAGRDRRPVLKAPPELFPRTLIGRRHVVISSTAMQQYALDWHGVSRSGQIPEHVETRTAVCSTGDFIWEMTTSLSVQNGAARRTFSGAVRTNGYAAYRIDNIGPEQVPAQVYKNKAKPTAAEVQVKKKAATRTHESQLASAKAQPTVAAGADLGTVNPSMIAFLYELEDGDGVWRLHQKRLGTSNKGYYGNTGSANVAAIKNGWLSSGPVAAASAHLRAARVWPAGDDLGASSQSYENCWRARARAIRAAYLSSSFVPLFVERSRFRWASLDFNLHGKKAAWAAREANAIADELDTFALLAASGLVRPVVGPVADALRAHKDHRIRHHGYGSWGFASEKEDRETEWRCNGEHKRQLRADRELDGDEDRQAPRRKAASGLEDDEHHDSAAAASRQSKRSKRARTQGVGTVHSDAAESAERIKHAKLPESEWIALMQAMAQDKRRHRLQAQERRRAARARQHDSHELRRKLWQQLEAAGKERPQIVIIGGDMGRPSSHTLRGTRPAPVRALIEALKNLTDSCGRNRLVLIDIDEFRTSRLCSCCGNALQACTTTGDDGKSKTLRGLRFCVSCNAFLDRDVNGALNMLNIFYWGPGDVNKPVNYRRETKKVDTPLNADGTKTKRIDG